MIEVTRTGRTIEYYMSDNCPHPFVPWKQLQDDGWCLTDDDMVVFGKVTEIQEDRGFSIRVRRRITFPFGNRYAHGKSVYNFAEALQKKSGGLVSMYWWEKVKQSEPALINIFAKLVIANKLPFDRYRYNKAEYLVFYALSKYFYNSDNQWRAIRTIFNHDKVREMIQKKIDDNLIKNGIDVDKVFDLIKSAEHMGRTHVDKIGNVGNPNVLLSVADRYAGLIGMNGKKQLSAPEGQDPAGSLPGAEHTYDNILKDGITEAVVIEDANNG